MAKQGSIQTGLGGDPQWSSPEDYNAQPAYSTSQEQSDALSKSGFADTAVGLYARWKSINDLEAAGTQKLSPEEANSRFPGMSVPFREPVNPYVAQMLSDRQQEEQELNRKVALGPQDIASKAKNFGTGLITHMMDPVEFGAGAVIGWGVGGAITKTAWGARAALAAEGGSLGSRTALNAVEAFSGNTIQNTLQEAAAAHVTGLEGLKYDPVQGMQNIAVSSVLGGLMGMGIKEGSFRFARYLKNTSPEADLKLMNSMKGEYDAGLKPDPGPLLTALAKETDVQPGDFGGKFNYEYAPPAPGPLEGKKFYIPHDASAEFNPDRARMVGEEHGIGVQMTDSPGVANAAANRAMADSPGVVYEADVSHINPLNLEAPLPESVKADFLKAMGPAISDAESVIHDSTAKDLLGAIHNAIDEGDLSPKVLGELQDDLKAKGYNGFIQNGTDVAGVAHSPHNLLTVFDGERVEPSGFRTIDPEIRNDPTQVDLNRVLESRDLPERKLYVDEDSLKEGQATLSQADKEGLQYEEPDDKEFFDEFKSMQDQGLVDEHFMNEVEKVQALDKQFEFEDKVMRAVMGCVRG